MAARRDKPLAPANDHVFPSSLATASAPQCAYNIWGLFGKAMDQVCGPEIKMAMGTSLPGSSTPLPAAFPILGLVFSRPHPR